MPIDRRTEAATAPDAEGLARILRRRRIAVGRDARDRVVLARPDSLLVSVGDDMDRRAGLGAWVRRYDARQADRIEAPGPDDSLGFVTVRFAAPRDAAGRATAQLDAAEERREQLLDAGHDVELNHVILGAPVNANPLGARAIEIGDVRLTAETPGSARGDPVMRTTAEPAAAPQVLRRRLGLPGHRRPKVLVMDSGLCTADAAGNRAEHPELRACRVHQPWINRAAEREVDDEDELDVDHTGTLDVQAGHGTFICGIVRQICPDAKIHTAGVLTSFGEGSVSGLLHASHRAQRVAGPFDIVVMSFGTAMSGDEPGILGRTLPPLLSNALVVAAAGNDGTSRPYFPAALPCVIGVGALASGGKAWFTNYGSWVDACAPAVGVVSTYFSTTETVEGRDLRQYRGWARWSGTSFAAPKVAAHIAQEMYLHGGSARDAWKRMTSFAHLRHPDLGVVVNI